MKLLIRADAAPFMGLGHVKRMIALARALVNSGANVRFLSRFPDQSWNHHLAEFEHDAILLPDGEAMSAEPAYGSWLGLSEHEDASQTLDRIEFAQFDWIVVDHYALSAPWHDQMRWATRARICAVDDLGTRPLSADIIIDHNWDHDHRPKYAKVNLNKAPILGGSRFAMLDLSYAKAPRYIFNEKVRSIGVFMGGGDSTAATLAVLDAIGIAGFSGAVEVVATSSNPTLPALRSRIACEARCRLTLDLPTLAPFFARHDLQIGAGGGATWERFCIGAPVIAVATAPNQAKILSGLVSEGAQWGVSQPDAVAIAEMLSQALTNPQERKRKAEAGASLVDGHGAARLAAALMRDALTVRPATTDDAAITHHWRNDPSIRATSRDSRDIAWEDHRAWHEASLTRADRAILIGQCGTRPVGVVRYDHESPGCCEVSIYLDPLLNGLGLGKRLLTAGEAWLCHNRPETTQIKAETLPENIASGRLFAQSGYLQSGHHFTKSLKGTTP